MLTSDPEVCALSEKLDAKTENQRLGNSALIDQFTILIANKRLKLTSEIPQSRGLNFSKLLFFDSVSQVEPSEVVLRNTLEVHEDFLNLHWTSLLD